MYKSDGGWGRVEHDDLAIHIVAEIVWRHDPDFIDPEVGEVVESWSH